MGDYEISKKVLKYLIENKEFIPFSDIHHMRKIMPLTIS